MQFQLPDMPGTALGLPPSETKIMTLEQLLPLRHVWRFRQEAVVFTNGCFDILHVGHVDYLERARALGTHLVVGLNTDASVQRLKGPSRPVNPLWARARVLAALGCVSAVVLFDDDTPLRLIQTLMPDVLCKGGDYTIDTVVGAPDVLAAGGCVKLLPFVEGFSTTRTIARLKGDVG